MHNYGMACDIKVGYPLCGSEQITRAGKRASGGPRYYCRANDCPTQTFMLNYLYQGYEPDIKGQIVEGTIKSVAPGLNYQHCKRQNLI